MFHFLYAVENLLNQQDKYFPILHLIILMYCMLPIFIYLSKSVSVKKFLLIGIILFSIIMLDEIYNLVIARVIHSPRASDVYQE